MVTARLHRLESDYRDAKNHIYGLAHNVCVNGKEQKELLNTLQNVEKHCMLEGLSGQETIISLMQVIYDGLAYGNWPWLIHNAIPKEE